MSCTPPHPYLALERPLTPEEMFAVLEYEGCFTIGDGDRPAADALAAADKAEVGEWKHGRGTYVCILRGNA